MQNFGFDRAQVLAGAEFPILDHGSVRYVAHLGDDATPLQAARMSTGNPTGVDAVKDAGTRDYLWREEHSTPFEMAVLQVEVVVPIFVAREWMRHRTQVFSDADGLDLVGGGQLMSFNEFSARYAEMPAVCYVPSHDRVAGQSTTNKQGSGEPLSAFEASCFRGAVAKTQEQLHAEYQGYLDGGVARELARINLPLSQYTKFRCQANLRNWLHFLHLRLSAKAQYEIRVYAEAVAYIVKTLWPETWEVFEEHTLDGVKLSRTEAAMVKVIMAAMMGDEKTQAELKADPILGPKLEEMAGDNRRLDRLCDKLGIPGGTLAR